MSFLTKTDVVLFSPMQGVITYKGQPVNNAKISRRIIWKGDEGEVDEFYTNEKGEFSIPIKETKVRMVPLAEFVLTQELNVTYQEQEFSIWVRAKQDLGEYGELGGKPVNFRCELTDKRQRLEEYIGLFGTSCKWDYIEK